MSTQSCTEVSPACPVELTTYGYYPNLAANTIFCVIFGLCGIIQLVLGIKFKTWTWLIGVAFGCLLEMAGYIGRIFMNENPWNRDAFKLQVVALILAPSLIAAGIDLIMKHVALTFGQELSRIKPRLYTWVFIGIDVFSILMQCAGGGIAASADDSNASLRDAGNNIIIVGIAIQIVQLIAFGLVAAEYAYRLYRSRQNPNAPQAAYLQSSKFRAFIIGNVIAYFAILIRCIYRLPEMAGGWGGELQRHEPSFLILDGAMIAIAAIAMTAVHPGIFFSQLSSGYYTSKAAAMLGEEKGIQSHALTEQSE